METADIETLRTSDEPEALREAAMRLAASGSQPALSAVEQSLSSAAFLGKLDSEKDYESRPSTLRVARVLEELEHNGSPGARQCLVRLTKNAIFLGKLSRVELLILACARLRPPEQDVIKFWTDRTRPGDSSVPLVVRALFENDTEPSMRLFEQLMLNQAHSEGDKVVWLRIYAVPHRDSLNFITAAQRLARGKLNDSMKFELLRVIFDFSPGWYPPSGLSVRPPNPLVIEPTAKDALKALGAYALAEMKDVPADVRIAIEKRLAAYKENAR